MNTLQARAGELLGQRKRVGHGHIRGPHGERHVKGGLEGRLVEARKGAARIDVFELRVRVAGASLARQVQADDPGVIGAVPGEVNCRAARTDRVCERELCHSLVGDLLILRGDCFAAGSHDRLGDVELTAVQPDHLAGLVQSDSDVRRALEIGSVQ